MTHSPIGAALDALDKTAFERLCNALLWAEWSARGRFWPNPTAHGVGDGGCDASFDGPVNGVYARWCVTVKHTLASDAVRALQGLLRPELERYPGRSWVLATNPTLSPAQQARIRSWACRSESTQRARQFEILERNALIEMLGRHPYVGRAHGVTPRGPRTLRVPETAEPIPRRWDRVRDDVLRAIDPPRAFVAIRGPTEMGHELLLRALAQSPPGQHAARYPLWVEVRDAGQLHQLDDELAALPAAQARYLFLVPPTQLAGPVLTLLRQLPGDHAIAVGVHGSDSLPDAQILDLPYPSDEAFRAWAEPLAGGSTYLLARLYELSGGKPGAALDWLRRGSARTTERVTRAIRSCSSVSGLGEAPAREALALLALSCPRRRESLDWDWLISITELGRAHIERVLEEAIHHGLLVDHEGRLDEPSPLEGAALLYDWRRRDRLRERLSERPELAFRLALRAEEERPLLAVLEADQDNVPDADFMSLNALSRRAKEAARVSDATGAHAVRVAAAIAQRAGRDDPFRSEAKQLPALARIGAPHLIRSAWDILIAAAWRAPLAPIVVADGLALVRSGHDLPLDALASQLVTAHHPDDRPPTREHAATGFAALLHTLEERADEPAARLAAAAAKIWLSCRTEQSAAMGSTISIVWSTWNTRHPGVQARQAQAVQVLWQLVDAPESAVRQIGWRAWGALWSGVSIGQRPALPSPLQEAAHALLRSVGSRFARAPWPERADIERATLNFAAIDEIDRQLLADAVHAFPSEPLYLAWRLVCDREGYVPDAVQLADALRAGATWAEVVKHTMRSMHDPSVAEEVATRLAAQVTDRAALHTWLAAAAARRKGDRAWGQPDVLAAWMRLAPTFFEPLVLGVEWEQVPSSMRALVIHAGRGVFGDRLGPQATGPVISGRQLGAALALGRLWRSPASVGAEDVAELLPALLAVVTPSNRAAALFAVAAHPAHDVRDLVLRLLIEWLSWEEPAPDPADGAAIVRALLRGDERDADLLSRLFAARTEAIEAHAPRWDALVPHLADEMLDRAAFVNLPEPIASEVVCCVGLDRWMQALSQATHHHPSGILTPRALPVMVARDAVARIAHEPRGDDDDPFWRSILTAVQEPITDAERAGWLRSWDEPEALRLLEAWHPVQLEPYLDAFADYVARRPEAERPRLLKLALGAIARAPIRPGTRGYEQLDERAALVERMAASKPLPARDALTALARALSSLPRPSIGRPELT